MGFFADIWAINKVQQIKAGGTAKISMSQIAMLITNMSDARKNLSKADFNAVNNLFHEFRRCNTKIEMNTEGYYELLEKIIRRFDEIAPYEKYCGGNELEFSLLMEDIRDNHNKSETIKLNKPNEIDLNDEAKKYMDMLIEKAPFQLSIDSAQDIMRVIYYYHHYGKHEALKEFDAIANKIIEIEREVPNAIIKISYLSGILYSNDVLTNEESDELSKKYSKELMELVV